MKVLLVLDVFDITMNGISTSAQRLKEELEKRGHEVRVAARGNEMPGKYLFKDFKFPIFDKLVRSQGFVFGIPDDKVMDEAVRWADIVHTMMPFPLERCAIFSAMRNGVPYTSSFHVQPENIWYSVHLGNFKPLINLTYWVAKKYVFDHCRLVQCPSAMIAGQLKKHHYKNEMKVISNGIDPMFHYKKREKDEEFRGKFLIVMSGRLSGEKRQDVLIEAVRKSKHSKDIQLLLAGDGPMKDSYVKRGSSLPNPIKTRFFKHSDLLDLFAQSDLYVHTSDAEIEGMGCMEAFASGLVPVIADSDRSATPQFALDERSLFKAGNSTDLANKIDYWIEHEEERKKMEVEYAKFANEKYSIDAVITQMEKMFLDEIALFKEKSAT